MKDLLEKLKNATPVVAGDLEQYLDADDEMQMIAEYIRKHNEHNSYVQPDRIKFLYSPKPKKDGGKFVLTELFKRSDMEKMVNDQYDFIITCFYDVWKKLEPEQKLIVMDKALCGIEVVEEKTKKKAPDSKEYLNNMHFYGAEKVMRISEQIDLACTTAMEQRKENAKNAKEAVDANSLDN
jgi:hypothetical protein